MKLNKLAENTSQENTKSEVNSAKKVVSDSNTKQKPESKVVAGTIEKPSNNRINKKKIAMITLIFSGIFIVVAITIFSYSSVNLTKLPKNSSTEEKETFNSYAELVNNPKDNAEKSDSLATLASSYEDSGNNELALKYYKEAIKYSKNNYKNYGRVAEIYLKNGDKVKATEYYKISIEKASNWQGEEKEEAEFYSERAQKIMDGINE